MRKKGFTLVELLAVIVILAIILIIAVPKIMDTIKNAKIASIESSAKLIASSIEKEYSVSMALGEGETLSKTGSCLNEKFVDVDLSEYESCTYTIDDNGKAKVTLKGTDNGKFSGLTCTDATKVSATCSGSNSNNNNNDDNDDNDNNDDNDDNDNNNNNDDNDDDNNTPTLTAAETIISKLDDGVGLEKIMYTDNYTVTTDVNEASHIEYRFTGESPSNYVTFNNEEWRIIGLFDGELKIIRSASLINKAWDEDDNIWSSSNVYSYLISYYNDSFSDTAKNMVDEDRLFNINAIEFDENLTAEDVYKEENTMDYSNDGYAKTGKIKIGLMNVSDYGFAATSECRNDFALSSYDNELYCGDNWLFNNTDEWTINPYYGDTEHVLYIMSDRVIMDGVVYGQLSVRPVVYLKSTVTITGGTGDKNNKYILN